jgi:hypothetical protein
MLSEVSRKRKIERLSPSDVDDVFHARALSISNKLARPAEIKPGNYLSFISANQGRVFKEEEECAPIFEEETYRDDDLGSKSYQVC